MDRVKWDTPYFKVWDGNSNKFWKGWCNPVNGIDEMYCGDIRALIFLRPTGLKDKNGVEIYEGDIVKVRSYAVTGLGKVEFNKGSFVFNNFEYTTSQVLHSFSEIEIIGNIYENPELLVNK